MPRAAAPNAVPDHKGLFLIFYGDAPLLTRAPAAPLIEVARGSSAPLALLTAHLDDTQRLRPHPARRERQRRARSASRRTAAATKRAIREFNPGVYAIDADFFRSAVAQLTTANKQGELYLTDMVAIAAAQQAASPTWRGTRPSSKASTIAHQLAARERELRLRRARAARARGVTVRDPESTFIDADVDDRAGRGDRAAGAPARHAA